VAQSPSSVRARIISVVVLVAVATVSLALAGYALVVPRAMPAEPAAYTPAAVTQSPAPEVDILAAAGTFIAAQDGTHALRYRAGTCNASAATAESTADAGVSWAGIPINPTPAGSAVQIVAAPSGDSVIATSGDACSAAVFSLRTVRKVTSFAPVAGAAADWFVTPGNQTAIVGSGGAAVTAPCTVVSLTTLNNGSAAVLCANERVFRTQDAGATWDRGLSIKGAVAIARSDTGFVVAEGRQKGCEGIAVSTLPVVGGRTPTALGCTSLPYVASTAALSWSPTGIWLWSQDTVTVSVDQGATWK